MSKNLLSIGQPFPAFKKTAVVSLEKGKEFYDISSNDLINDEGRWTVMFWWPKDFTFVCPTEIAEFNKSFGEFRDRTTNLIGASTDSEFVHLAWRKNHEDLKDLKFPMLADTSKSLAEDLGILEENEKIAYRATFIIDPQGIIRWVSVYDLSVGRNVKEVVRVLDALQTDELCPCNWEKGKETIKGLIQMEEALTYSETTREFLEFLNTTDGFQTEALDFLEEGKSRYVADLKINFKNSFESEYLTKLEIALLGIALSVNANNKTLLTFFNQKAKEESASAEAIAEAVGCASLLSANNVLYRFRHFTKKEKYEQIPARIKMNIMGRPVSGKEFFELMSLAVSAVNGCEMCVTSHEASLIELGAKEERIFEAVRFASVVTSASKIIY